MRSVKIEPSASSCVRVAFDGAAISFDVAVDTTLGEIALFLERILNPRYGDPVSVKMTLGFAGMNSERRQSDRTTGKITH